MRYKTKNSVIKRTFPPFLLLMLTFFITITVAEARSPIANYSPVRVEIIDDRGRVFRQIKTSSQAYKVKRAYVEAKKGKRYSLRLRNMSNQRVGVIIAVDGRNILTGKKSWLRSHEKMYILSPYETATYKGWRTGKSRINRFFFTAEGNSYAKAWRDSSAMGVIALAVFNEKPRIAYQQENSLRSNKRARSAPSAAADAGTGFGREEYSPTMKVHFKARNHPIAKHFYKYEWRSSLCKRGVIQCYDRPRKQDNRFWREESYAPYPPGMNRNDYHPNHNNPPYNDPRDHNPLFDF
jgi:hypothetical protein